MLCHCLTQFYEIPYYYYLYTALHSYFEYWKLFLGGKVGNKIASNKVDVLKALNTGLQKSSDNTKGIQ